jgi:hypothetical protein
MCEGKKSCERKLKSMKVCQETLFFCRFQSKSTTRIGQQKIQQFLKDFEVLIRLKTKETMFTLLEKVFFVSLGFRSSTEKV